MVVNGLSTRFRCIILFLSVIIVCFVPAAAFCGFVSHEFSIWFLLNFFSGKRYGDLLLTSCLSLPGAFIKN